MTQIGLRKHLRPFQVNEAYPLGFARVKHDSYLNEETSREKKKRPITFFNNIYKWFTSSMQIPVDNHLNLMEGEQRGWRLDVAEPQTTSSLTRCWSRTIIMANEIAQLNVIIDVLSGWSKNLEKEMTNIFGKAGKQVLKRKNAESSTKHLS